MSVWGHLFAAMYDRMLASTERDCLGAHRQALLADATGDVLEIGGGTGANLPYYGADVRSLTITEPERADGPPPAAADRRAAARRDGSCARRRRTFRSTTTASTRSSRRSCCAPSTTSPGR